MLISNDNWVSRPNGIVPFGHYTCAFGKEDDMINPRDHFGKVWFTLSLASAEFFVFRTEPVLDPWFVTAALGFLFMYVTFLPALLIVALIYSALGWMD